MKMTKHKTWISTASAVLMVLVAAQTLPLEPKYQVWVAAGIAVLNAVLVYAVRNKPVDDPSVEHLRTLPR